MNPGDSFTEKKGNISPHIFVLSTFFVSIISFFIFRRIGYLEEYFFAPIFGLAVIYGLINLIRQSRGLSHFSIQRGLKLYPLLKKSVIRYVVWFIIIYSGYRFYKLHPYYSQYSGNIAFFSYFLWLYLVIGLPYFFITLIFKSSKKEDFYDPAIRIMHIFKQITLRLLRLDNNIFGVLRNKYNRKVLLNIIMRAYFIPIMIVQVYSNLNDSIRYSADNFRGYDFFTICLWLSAILWLTDTINASLSYCIESRWIENRSRSIDLTVGGWLVCLSCYAPINNITGTFFPFGPLAASRHPDSIFFYNAYFLYSLKIAEIIILTAHIYADVSLGPSIANITYKKLQTRGLYGIIRHPGTIFKLLLWWVQAGLYKEFWRIDYIYGHLMWNAIYILRALTEERHLSKFKDYREYKEKVKYRFLPGIV
jgi:protein-S-isoprenylcysteine O-methyltransferase Ste14